MALRVRGVRMRGLHGGPRRADGVPLRARAQVEVRTMAEGCPMLPCSLCDLVPGRPESQPDGRWRIRCPICGREAFGATEDGARAEWGRMNAPAPKPLSPVLQTTTIRSASCEKASTLLTRQGLPKTGKRTLLTDAPILVPEPPARINAVIFMSDSFRQPSAHPLPSLRTKKKRHLF